MKLSIITVNLNNRDGLQKTIDSVVSQTFHDFEWIVIDGGSTDGSKELIEQYADHFAYWVSEPDKGIYNAMNKGIKVARGEYLQFLNSGDWLWEDTTLEKVFNQHLDEDILYGNNVEVSGKVYVSPDELDTLHFYRSTINHQASFTRASLLKETLYDESYKVVSDWLFYMKKVVFENASYRKLDIIITSGQAGCSYDLALYASERDEILKKTFSPMQRTTLEKYALLVDNPMRPYYDYIDEHPCLRKNIRRLVRLIYPVGKNDTSDNIR